MLQIPTQGMQYIYEYTFTYQQGTESPTNQLVLKLWNSGTRKNFREKQKCCVKHVGFDWWDLLWETSNITYIKKHNILTWLLLICPSKPAKPKRAGFDCASQHAIYVSNSINAKAHRMICQEPSLCDCQKSLHHSNQKYQWNAAALAAVC